MTSITPSPFKSKNMGVPNVSPIAAGHERPGVRGLSNVADAVESDVDPLVSGFSRTRPAAEAGSMPPRMIGCSAATAIPAERKKRIDARAGTQRIRFMSTSEHRVGENCNTMIRHETVQIKIDSAGY
jgi:hypothetical protein